MSAGIAAVLAEARARVALADLDVGQADELTSAIGAAAVVLLDVTSVDDVRRAVGEVCDGSGRSRSW